MYGEVILKSELDAFKANNIPPTETVLAEWILKTLRKGRLISSHHVGNTYLIICTDTSLYFLKLAQKKIRGYKKYSLLDFTNIQVGYLSKTGEDALDECEVNPGLFAIRFYFTPDSFKTFKHPASDTNDDAQKALIQVIFSSIKATRRELYRNSPATVIPIPTNNNNNNNNHKNKSRSNSFASASSSPSSPPALSRASSLKQDSFMITIDSTLLLDAVEHDPIDGVITITQKHFVFEPTVGTSLVELSESITIPLFKVAECVVLDDDDIPLEVREYVLRKKVKVLQLFADGQRYCFSILSTQADSTCARLGQWVQAAQDKLAQEIISMTTIEHPLLGQEENNTNFKGDSDIMSAKDVLYLQYKMPERYSMEKWEMVYSTTRHGISINTFYTKVAQRAPCIIVVEDVNHHVFGGYASEPWVKTKQVHYGSGESFLFKLKPVSKVFKWSKLNDYFMFSKPDFISFGSGGDGYGLWLDADFDHGSSATSDTYLNEQLSVTEIFKILKVEVWAPPVYFQKKQTRPLV